MAEAFAAIASRLLLGSTLYLRDAALRIAEVEWYQYSDEHPDPFAHRDPLQRQAERWYFHKSGGSYRAGSFKGLDLTLGDGQTYCGVLLRSLIAADGQVINGPSLCVDYLLRLAGQPTIAAFDAELAGRKASDPTCPLRLSPREPASDQIYYSARVGLSLKKAPLSEAVQYILRPYRALIEPRSIRKGAVHLAAALLLAGASPAKIRQATHCPLAAIERYRKAIAAGAELPDLAPLVGQDLSSDWLCRLHGALKKQGLPTPDK